MSRLYYAERNGLLNSELNLDLDNLLKSYRQIYDYFNNQGFYEPAFRGVWRQIPYSNDTEQIKPPLLAPAPETYFAVKLQSTEVWPITEYLEYYDEAILFSVIEILYDNIGYWDYNKGELIYKQPQEEYVEQVNNVLKAYRDGYYLEPSNGFIMKQPNQALREQLKYDGSGMEPGVYEKLRTATELFYRFDSNLETKKKAINILADVLENVRENLKTTFEAESQEAGKKFDKEIFGIVNSYNIRHNRADQKSDYDKAIWYDWMLQYYTSTIIAYYRLNETHTILGQEDKNAVTSEG